MISVEEFSQIVTTYQKHGWILRRVLLSAATRERLIVPHDVVVNNSNTDAAWFSRPPKPGEVAWEIRSLGSTPFALVQFVDEDSPDFEQVLEEVKDRLAESLTQRKRLDN